MLEYFSYQKLKKHQAEKAAREASPVNNKDISPTQTTEASSSHPPTTTTTISQPHDDIPLPTTPSLAPQPEHMHNIPRKPLPVLTEEDEDFLRGFVNDETDLPERRPVLPTRPVVDVENMRVAGDATGNESQLVVHDGKEKEHGKKETYGEYVGEFVGGIRNRFAGKGKEKEEVVVEEEQKEKENEKDVGKGKEKEKHEGGRFGFIGRTFSKKDKKPEQAPIITPEEAAAETADITTVLDSLNLSAVNNRAFSISAESQALLEKFTVILKDLVNGVPTAFDDLTHLLDNSQETLEKGYENLPSFLQKLVAQLPAKLTGSLGPELMAAATASQGLNATEASAAAAGGFSAAAKSFLKPSTLKDLVTKPGAVVTMLKSIMNVLKLRWPAFMGTNVLFSLGLFILLFVFWYCHKRGREERIKREGAPLVVDSEGRIVELEDDPLLPSTTIPTTAQAGPSGTNATTTTALPIITSETQATDRVRSQSRSGRQAEPTLRPDVSEGASRSRPTSASSWRSGRSLRRRKEKEGEVVEEVVR